MAVTLGEFFIRSLERAVAKNKRLDLIGQEDKDDIEDETCRLVECPLAHSLIEYGCIEAKRHFLKISSRF